MMLASMSQQYTHQATRFLASWYVLEWTFDSSCFPHSRKGQHISYARGDTVVHPQHGAANVVGTVSKDVGRGPENYLELHVTATAMRILVPERSLQDVGVRDVSTRKQAEAILAVLQEPSDVSAVWSERNVTTATRMKSTDLEELAMVVRDLTRHAHRGEKPLTMGENRAVESCLDILAKELSLTLGISEQDTRALILEKCVIEAA